MVKEIAVAVDDGSINVIRFGTGSKNFVIIAGMSLCGLKGQGVAIAAAYRLFQQEYTCYLIERRDVLHAGSTVRDMAEDVYQALCALGVENADIFGVSQGGMIAMQLAIEHPSMVTKLVLGSTAARLDPGMKAVFTTWKQLAAAGDVGALNRRFFCDVYSEPFIKQNKAAFRLLEKIGTKENCERFAILAEACIRFDVYAQLQKIRCPVLVMGAVLDRVFPGRIASTEIAEQLHCPCDLYDAYGHAVYDEAPDYKEKVYRFLQETDLTGTKTRKT